VRQQLDYLHEDPAGSGWVGEPFH